MLNDVRNLRARITRALSANARARVELFTVLKKESRGQDERTKRELAKVIGDAVGALYRLDGDLHEARATVDRASKRPLVPYMVGERELEIRGFWDRYPSSEQKRWPERYEHIAKRHRRGPTAYDLLARDYESFTAQERKHLQVRVAYGVNAETGKIFGQHEIANFGLILNLARELPLALHGLSRLLVRAGVVDTPSEWTVNTASEMGYDDEDEELDSIPLGIQWWIVPE